MDGSVTLCQRRYIDGILKRFGMEDSLASPISWKASKWVHRLLREISTATGASSPKLVVFEDNQSCIKVGENPVVNLGRAKHIEIKCHHHTRDEVKRGEVEVEYCSTWTMVVDAFAKGLPGPRHAQLVSDIGIKSCWRR